MRSLSQIRAGDQMRDGMAPIPGSKNYFKQGGLPANPQMAYDDGLLRHRSEADGSVSTHKAAKSWKVDAQQMADEQIDSAGRSLSASVREVIGNIPKVGAVFREFGRDESDRIGSTKRARLEARALRDNEWWETPADILDMVVDQ
jgi:hypothetical protein